MTLTPPFALLQGVEAFTARARDWSTRLDQVAGASVVLPEIVSEANQVQNTDPILWASFRALMVADPLHCRLRQDPLIARAWARMPRTSPIDPVLGDLMLRHHVTHRAIAQASSVGRDLNLVSAALPWPEAVRDRGRLIARLADAAAERRAEAMILGIGTVRAREAALSLAAPEGGILRWVILNNHKPACGPAVEETMPWLEYRRGDVRRSLSRAEYLPRFDLAYMIGLEGYIDCLAIGMIRAAFEHVRPGGHLLLSGRAPGLGDAAFWDIGRRQAICPRDEAAMASLVSHLPEGAVARCSIFAAPNGAVQYALIERG